MDAFCQGNDLHLFMNPIPLFFITARATIYERVVFPTKMNHKSNT